MEHDNLEELIENSYPELYDSISKDYTLEYLNFDMLREITVDDEVIGFITFKHLNDIHFSIEECYIKPEFRGKGIIYEELLKISSIPNILLYARRPNYAFMCMLKKHRLVETLLGDIAGLGIENLSDSDDVYVNSDIERFYDLEVSIKDLYCENVYDFDSKLIYLQDVWGNVSRKPSMIAIIRPRKSDLEKYDFEKTFEKYDIFYIDDISARLYPYHEDIENCWSLLEWKLSKYNNVETIVGSSNKLTDEMKILLKENNLDESAGFDIRDHIIKANDKTQLKDKYNRVRRDYLLKNPDKIKCEINVNLYHNEGICPVCGADKIRNHENCVWCGFDFENSR